RTVTQVTITSGALECTATNDPDTNRCTPEHDYTKFLKADGLKGARIGIPRMFYYDKLAVPGEEKPRGGLNDDQKKVMDEAIGILKQQGAVLVDPADIPSIKDLVQWSVCRGEDGRGKDANCPVLLKYGL